MEADFRGIIDNKLENVPLKYSELRNRLSDGEFLVAFCWSALPGACYAPGGAQSLLLLRRME